MRDAIAPATVATVSWMYAEIVDAAGSVVVRTEGCVSDDDDITALARSAVDRYRRANPDTSVADEIGTIGFTIRFGSAAPMR